MVSIRKRNGRSFIVYLCLSAHGAHRQKWVCAGNNIHEARLKKMEIKTQERAWGKEVEKKAAKHIPSSNGIESTVSLHDGEVQ